MQHFPPDQFAMQLICSRNIPFIDTDTLSTRIGCEALFRKDGLFLLYLSDGAVTPLMQERVVSLSARQALLWLNEDAEEVGSFWG